MTCRNLLLALLLSVVAPAFTATACAQEADATSGADADGRNLLNRLDDEAISHLWDDDVFTYIDRYEAAARKYKNSFFLAESFRQRVFVYAIVRQHVDTAKMVLQQMQHDCPDQSESLFKAKRYILNGYEERGEYNLAVNECKQLLNSTTDSKEKIIAYMTLVELHNQTETFGQALQYALKAADISEHELTSGPHRHYALANIYVYVANMLTDEQNVKSQQAIVYLNKADSIFRTDGKGAESLMDFRENFLWYGYGQYYAMQKDRAKVMEYVAKLRQEGSDDSRRLLFAVLDSYYDNIGDYRAALAALDSLAQVKELMNMQGYSYSYWKNSARYYERLGDKTNALRHYSRYVTMQDSLYKERDRIQANEFAQILQTEEIRQQRDALSITLGRRNQQLLGAVLVFALMAIVLLVLWVVRERRQRRHLSEAHHKLQQAFADIEKLSQMKSSFIRNISHEIRTPLNQIVGFAQVIAMLNKDDDTTRQYTNTMLDQTGSLLRIINDTITLSDIESQPMQCEPVRIGDCCTEAYEAVATMKKSGVEYQLQMADAELTFDTDRRRMVDLLRNLLSNAFKFTAQGTVTLDCHMVDGHLHLSVIDTGCGVPADKLEWVFGRFCKVDEFVPGAGLGLSVCKEIVERQGGTIAISPDYTEGCRVDVIL